VLKREPPLDHDSSGGGTDELETIQPYPIPLRNLETIILESTSFLAFRERYRAFLFPRSDPQSSSKDAGIPTDEDVPELGSESPGPEMGFNSGEKEEKSLLYKGFAAMLARARRFVRRPVKRG
jgi:hypothetical protein